MNEPLLGDLSPHWIDPIILPLEAKFCPYDGTILRVTGSKIHMIPTLDQLRCVSCQKEFGRMPYAELKRPLSDFMPR